MDNKLKKISGTKQLWHNFFFFYSLGSNLEEKKKTMDNLGQILFRLEFENVIPNYETLQLTTTNNLTLRLLMSYIYGAPILDVSRSHTRTHHSR